MTREQVIEQMARVVSTSQWEASKRGALAMWTIFKQPADFPDCYVARQFDVRAGQVLPTTPLLRTANAADDDLALLRDVFDFAGLVCLPRLDGDETQIVESWT